MLIWVWFLCTAHVVIYAYSEQQYYYASSFLKIVLYSHKTWKFTFEKLSLLKIHDFPT